MALVPLYQLIAWWVVLTAVPLAWALSAHSALRRDERVYRLTFFVAPLLLGLLWLHGLIFDRPERLAGASTLELLTSTFQPRDPAFFAAHSEQLLLLAAPGVLVAIVFMVRGVRSIEHAWNRRTAAISYGLQVCAWLLLRELAEALVELRGLTTVIAALCVPLPALVLAILFGRQSVEANPSPA